MARKPKPLSPPSAGSVSGDVVPASPKASADIGDTGPGEFAGARIHRKYFDRTEDVVAVTRDDLREIGTIGYLQAGTAAVGMFFLSGAFWALMSLFAEHGQNESYYSWYFTFLTSIVFGATLTVVGVRLYYLKVQSRSGKFLSPMNRM
jgi:hypothetical protein